MTRQLLVAGGGIAGLAAGLAGVRGGWHVHLYEQAPELSEVGAGIQLGPNATRVLRCWGLLEATRALAFAPQRLVSREAADGRQLAAMPLGAAFESRYGAPYLTIHRADLHAVLLRAASEAGVLVHPGLRADSFVESKDDVRLVVAGAEPPEGDALVVADGLWSRLRQQVLHDGPPTASDHVAYRALVPMASLPPRWHAPEVCAWLGPRLHAVTYPVRGGEALNIVCVVQQPAEGEHAQVHAGWDHPAAGEQVRAALSGLCAPLRELVASVPGWGLWVLHDRPPVGGPGDMARGRVALVGDAAHPMRPYLAQGAAMALEDAFELGRVLAASRERVMDIPTALQRYALNRWQRCASVQRRSLRNATIFHAGGLVRLGRNLALRGLGGRMMDVPWLYEGVV